MTVICHIEMATTGLTSPVAHHAWLIQEYRTPAVHQDNQDGTPINIEKYIYTTFERLFHMQ